MDKEVDILRFDTSKLDNSELRTYVRMLEEEIHEYINNQFLLADIIKRVMGGNNELGVDDMSIILKLQSANSSKQSQKGGN